MIVPATRAIVLVAVAGGILALTAALAPGTTAAVVTAAALLAALTAADALFALRAARGLSVAGPALLRTARLRSTSVPLVLTNRSAGRVLAPRLAPKAPQDFEADEKVLDCGLVLAPGQQVTVESSLSPQRRGDFRLETCAVRTTSRWGLWAVQTSFPLNTTIRVYPDLLSDPAAAEFLRRGRAGTRIARHTGKGREFEKLRDYLPGDSYDEVDWKATARRGKPVARVFQVERTQEIYVALDASRLSARRAGNETALERYVHSALVMALAAEEQGDRFGLISFSDRVHACVKASRGRTHFKVCREAIYKLQPRLVEPDFGEFFAFLKTRLTRRALVIVLTALDDPLAAETFSRYVGVASRRHLIIAGMPRPEGAGPLFESSVAETGEIYHRLGGHLRWRKLNELKRSCEQKGVPFHLLDPKQFSGQLAQVYLDVKKRQIL